MTQTAMRSAVTLHFPTILIIWYGLLAIILFGSWYPFHFKMSLATAENWSAFWSSGGWLSHRGDILGNIALFVPSGFVGMWRSKGRALPLRWLSVLIPGLIIAVIAQIGQIALPQRDADMTDVYWNMVGLLPGLLLVPLPLHYMLPFLRSGIRISLAPAMILSVWVFHRLIPFIPSLDLKVIKNSLKPLLINPEWDMIAMLAQSGYWLVFLWLFWQAVGKQWAQRLLLPLFAVIFGSEILMIRNDITMTDMLAVFIAGGAWLLWLCKLAKPARYLSIILIAAIVLDYLYPFAFSGGGHLVLIPFQGHLTGNMLDNARLLTGHMFVYGALIWLIRDMVDGLRHSVSIALCVIAVIEIMQVYQPGRTADVTEPLLVIVMGMFISFFVPREIFLGRHR